MPITRACTGCGKNAPSQPVYPTGWYCSNYGPDEISGFFCPQCYEAISLRADGTDTPCHPKLYKKMVAKLKHTCRSCNKEVRDGRGGCGGSQHGNSGCAMNNPFDKRTRCVVSK